MNYWYKNNIEILKNKYNFKWDNHSSDSFFGDIENCVYKVEKGIKYFISANYNEKFTLEINIPTIFGEKKINYYDLTFDEVLKKLNLGFNKKIGIYLLKFNLSLYLPFFILVNILFSFLDKGNFYQKFKYILKNTKKAYNYSYIQDFLPLIWGINLIIIGILIGIILK